MENKFQCIFGIFADDEKKDSVRAENLLPLLRSVGCLVDEEKLPSYTKEGQAYFTFEEVEEIIGSSNMVPKITNEQVIEAFQKFDKKKTSKISISYLKHILQQGETPFNCEEIDAAIELLNPDVEGLVSYIANTTLKNLE